MEMPRLNKSVRRVTKIQFDDRGDAVPTVLYKAKTRKKKGTSALKPLERIVRKVTRAQSRMADSYVQKHERSNEKRKDGWLKDLASNVSSAGNKGRKTLSKNSLRWPKIISLT